MIFGIVTIIFLMFMLAIFSIFQHKKNRPVRNTINIESSEQIDESMQLGQMITIKGTPSIQLPLHSKQKNSGSYSYKSTDSVRNYLYIAPESLKQTWLLEHNNFLIYDTDPLFGKEEKPTKLRAISYKIIKTDTDDNNKLDRQDLKTLALSHTDGTNYTEIVQDANELLAQTISNKNNLVIIYQKNETNHLVTVDLSSFKIIHEEKLSIPTPKQ